MGDGAPSIPPALFSDVCPNCAYALTGLPDVGTCPECGRTYDRSEIVLYGWAIGQHENLSNARRSRVVWLMIFPFLFLSGQLFPYLYLLPGKYLLYFLFPVIPIAYRLSRRQITEHPGKIQVRLSERGCVQYDDLAGPSVLREMLRAHGWIVPTFAAVVLATGWGVGWVDTVLLLIFFPMALIAAVIAWRVCAMFRMKVRQVRDGAIADAYEALTSLTPWTEVDVFSLFPKGSDRHEFRIRRRVKFLQFVRMAYPVEAAITCTPAQAQQLRELIHRWSSAANASRRAS